MPILASLDTCTGCLACLDNCSFDAITYKYKSDGFFYPDVKTDACTECKTCEKACPVINGYSYERFNGNIPKAYVAWSPKDDTRMKSSSGGAFPEFAKAILDNNGVVIGAAIKGLYIKHITIDNIADLHLLQGSKYLQSNTVGIYNASYEYLKNGKTVLFSGTPCQIGGLLSFLRKKTYKGKLYTIDVVCHGVPSRLPIDKYNESVGGTLKGFKTFRNKKDSWLTSVKPEHCVTYKKNGLIDRESLEAGAFQMGSFLKDITLRMSCYDCKFAHFKRKSDLSVADFWQGIGYQEEYKKGITLVSVNTENGQELLNRSKLIKHKITWGKAGLWYNSRFFTGTNSFKKHPARKMMPLLMNILPTQKLKQIYALQDCESGESEQYKNEYKIYENENYQANKQTYFKVMLENVKFVNILTTQMAYNYGSVLQAYALKQVVERMGYDVRLINLKPDCFDTVAFNFKQPGSEKVRIAFNDFRRKNFPYSLSLYDEEGNYLKFNRSDIFIVGSDQVWNVRYSGEYWREYFLSFVPDKNKRIAYATSLGEKSIKLAGDELAEVNTYLHRFSAISCREKDGATYIKEQFDVNAIRVLDPTLLGINYNSLFNPVNYPTDKKYLTFFGFGADRLIQNRWVRYMAKEINLQVRVMNGNPVEIDFEYDHYVSPEEWLARIYNASFIVTNSYHACLFAIIFKKPFIMVPRSLEQNQEEQEYSRYLSLFSDIGLEDRIFSSFEEIQSDHRWKNPIDYNEVYKKMEPLREFSLQFLKQALEK